MLQMIRSNQVQAERLDQLVASKQMEEAALRQSVQELTAEVNQQKLTVGKLTEESKNNIDYFDLQVQFERLFGMRIGVYTKQQLSLVVQSDYMVSFEVEPQSETTILLRKFEMSYIFVAGQVDASPPNPLRSHKNLVNILRQQVQIDALLNKEIDRRALL